MIKTGLQIEEDFFIAVNNSLGITGSYYRDGMRPPQNVGKSEDCIVIHKTGVDGDIQSGYITLNVYTPNLPFNGRKVKHLGRCEEIEASLNQFAESVRLDGYMVEREGTIKTFQVFETDEHFVHLELKYNYVSI